MSCAPFAVVVEAGATLCDFRPDELNACHNNLATLSIVGTISDQSWLPAAALYNLKVSRYCLFSEESTHTHL